MFMMDQVTSEVIFVRYEFDSLKKEPVNELMLSTRSNQQKKVSNSRSVIFENKIFTVTRKFMNIPPGNCILSEASPFYRSDLSSMSLSPPMCDIDDIDECTDCHLLKFPKMIQISYENRTILCNLQDIDKIINKKLGRH